MPLPDYQSLMLPVLQLAAAGETDVRRCADAIARQLRLDGEALAAMLPSGKETVFLNRIRWAKTYLDKAGLLKKAGRGRFVATPGGIEVVASRPQRIDNAYLERFPEYQAFRRRAGEQPGEVPAAGSGGSAGTIAATLPAEGAATPEERIEAAQREIEAELRAQLLERIIAAPPAFFEAMIVDLMVAMGYGGTVAEAGQRVGRSGDGGIDGLVNQDVLGLDTVYLQAKRYAPGNVVGVDKVREFAGALVERGAGKGVFVTTSHFAAGASWYTDRIPQRLILIDGDKLTDLLFRYNIGVRTTRTIELKRLDLDYFEED